jgi:hypothetical protein
MMRRLALVALISTVYLGDAQAQMQFLYGGLHPIHPGAGGGFCYTNAPHDHPYDIDPNIGYLYRNQGGYNHFVGNPYHFGYQGQAFPYYGHHPISRWGSFCYLDGLHHHWWVPSPWLAASYLVNGGTYYYNGVFAPAYYSWRTSWYRPRHTYWYVPGYRRWRSVWRGNWRRYYRPASIGYIHRPPVVTYRSPGRVTVVRNYVRPAYRYNMYRPTTHRTYYRPGVRTTTVTSVRPSGRVVRTTTVRRTWRRR